MDELIDSLELLAIRLRCGHTPTVATKGLPQPHVSIELNRRWIELRHLIDDGRIPSLGATEGFLEHVKTVQRLESLLRLKAGTPRLQSRILAGTALLFSVAALWLFPPNLAPAPHWLLIAFAFFGCGFAGSELLIRRFCSQLWFSDWLLFLSRVNQGLGWGQTLPAILHERPWAKGSAKWPLSLKRELEIFARLASAGLDPLSGSQAGNRSQPEQRQAHEQLDWIKDQWRRGEPLGPVLAALLPAAVQSFERRLSMRAERLGFTLLLPLFAGFLPGFLALLLGPILESLAKSA